MLRRNGFTTIYITLSEYRLRWLGHVLRMSDKRIPKALLLYSELIVGKRNVGQPKQHYKDIFKRNLKSVKNVDIDDWERLTNDRNKWRSLITKRLRE